MSVDLQRLNVKLYLKDEESLSPEDAFRMFNSWIRETTEEILIDVADYSHVPRGPKTLLVGHESNYGLDNTDGRMGLLYGRKTEVEGTSADRIRQALVTAMKAGRRLEQHPDLVGKVCFRGEELSLIVNDRLGAPNDAESLRTLRTELEPVLGELYGGEAVDVVPHDDERQRLTVQVKASGSIDLSSLLARLE